MSDKKNKDMPSAEFREMGYKTIDWVADYIDNIASKPVYPNINPGDVKKKLSLSLPENGEDFKNFFKDLDDIITPGTTHWNHPLFMAYFNSSGSGPGILAEIFSAAFNINGMLWKSAPASNELENVTLGWLREMLGLPENFWGIIYDTASTSSMHAIAAAREQYLSSFKIKENGLTGRSDIPKLRLYCSEQAHSSIDKAALLLGIGLDGIKKIPVNEKFEMITSDLEKTIKEDKAKGWLPFFVVATVGTTSTTSVDPVKRIGEVCSRENIWLHVDAAHAGVVAIIPEKRNILDGMEYADSFVVNPHKWMFTPIDLSVLYTKKPELLKQAFSLVPEYLKTAQDDIAENLMDYGIPLGRRFRSLKLWFVIRYFGVNGLREIINEHLRLGKLFEEFVKKDKNFELMAPVPFSTICFRAAPDKISDVKLDEFNETLINSINETRRLFLSHTKLNNKFVIRVSISSIRTEEKHVKEAWDIIQSEFNSLISKKIF